jgi:hypothetical protein
MKVKEIEFTLPLGYADENSQYHRKGTMQAATALIEIEVHNDENAINVNRYRDCLLLSKVITRLGDISPVDVEIIKDLYEVDFIYLQLLYNKLNSDMQETIETECPHCGSTNKIFLPELYNELHHIYQEHELKSQNRTK